MLVTSSTDPFRTIFFVFLPLVDKMAVFGYKSVTSYSLDMNGIFTEPCRFPKLMMITNGLYIIHVSKLVARDLYIDELYILYI